jgi:hypothetical protein
VSDAALSWVRRERPAREERMTHICGLLASGAHFVLGVLELLIVNKWKYYHRWKIKK